MGSYDEHSAPVILKSDSLLSGYTATWINVLEVIQEGEECFFSLPLGTVVTGPEWCEHVGLPEEQRQQWKQLISVTHSNGVITKGMTISQVLGNTTRATSVHPDGNPPHAIPPVGLNVASTQQHRHSTPIQQQQAGGHVDIQLTPSRNAGTDQPPLAADIIKAEPGSNLAGGQMVLEQQRLGSIQSDELAECLGANGQQIATPVTLQENIQLQDTPAEIISNIPDQRQRPPPPPSSNGHIEVEDDVPDESLPPSPAYTSHVPGLSQASRDPRNVGRSRQHAVSQAVRVTLTNYDIHQTVYALWTNADDVVKSQQDSSPAEPSFLQCEDESFQPAMGAKPTNAIGLAKLAFSSKIGHAKAWVRLGQRWRTVTGHCFYPGMSVAQIMCVVSSNNSSREWKLGQDWDETATDPVVDCSMDADEQACVRVAAFHSKSNYPLYGKARLPAATDSDQDFRVTVCDSHYNSTQPEELISTRGFLKQAGYSTGRGLTDRLLYMFTTQGLRLPSGFILPPGTTLQQVIDEFGKLRGLDDSDDEPPSMSDTQSQDTSSEILNEHFVQGQLPSTMPAQQVTRPSEGLRKADGVSRAVRVTITNYDTHETVHAIWTNADDVTQPLQDPSAAEPLFLHCKDETYQPAVGTKHVAAAGLARLAAMRDLNQAKHRVRLHQRWRAITGHCFYPGMSLAQVLHVMSSDKDSSQWIFDEDWGDTTMDHVVAISMDEQAWVHVAAFYAKKTYAVFGKAQLPAAVDSGKDITVTVCDSHYNVMQPEQSVTPSCFMRRAGHSAGRSVQDRWKYVFLTQGLQLPSGFILPPGTSLQQVTEELDKLKSKDDDDEPHSMNKLQSQNASMDSTSSLPDEQNQPSRTPKDSILGRPPPTKAAADVPVGRRQHEGSLAVRVTVTNYDTHETVYALWINADDVLHTTEAPSRQEALFMRCTDATYQPVVGAEPLNATGLAQLASLSDTGNFKYRVHLNQRFKAASGHCFYPGMSLEKVMCVVFSAIDASHMRYGQDWVETAVDPVVNFSMASQTQVRVMAYHPKTMCAVYAYAQLPAVAGTSTRDLITVCDSQYNVKQPLEIMSISRFLSLAGYVRSNKAVFLTQGIRLPSGLILWPGTPLFQVIKELDKLRKPDGGDGGSDDAPAPSLTGAAVIKQQSDAAVHSRHDMAPKTCTVGKKRPASAMEDTNRSTCKKVFRDSMGTKEQAGHDAQRQKSAKRHHGNEERHGSQNTSSKLRKAEAEEQQVGRSTRHKISKDNANEERTTSQKQPVAKRHQEYEECLQSHQAAAKEKKARMEAQPLETPSGGGTNIAAVSKDVAGQTSTPSTAVEQPVSPTPGTIQQPPIGNIPTQQRAPGSKPPPSFPQLNFRDDSIHTMSLARAWSAICSLLRFLGCSNDAVRQLWTIQKQWEKEGEEKMGYFAMSYAQLADAVEHTDWEFVKELLKENFQLTV